MKSFLSKDVSKNAILIISALYGVYLIWYLSNWSGYFFLDVNRGPSLVVKLIFLIGYPLVAVLPLSLLTYKMDERIFRAWFNFICIGVPVTSIIVIKMSLVEDAQLGGSILSGFNSWLAYRFGLILPIALFIISFGIIIWKSYWFHKKPAIKSRK